MPINFPNTPTNNQVYTYGSQTWFWANNLGVWQSNNTTFVTVSNTVPSTAVNGSLWWNTETAVMYVYYTDADSSQWVPASPYAGNPGTPTVSNAALYTYSIILGRG